MTIDNNKVVFISGTEMKTYCGREDNQSGGGKYVEKNGYGHELFNFKEDNGHCYGYSPPYGNLNLDEISNTVNTDALGKYIDNVLVIFTGQRESKGRIIVGWYKNARVYAKKVDDKRQSRYFELIHKCVGYNIVCAAQDAVLVEYHDRSFIVPNSKTNNGVGYGQSNLWYANKPKDITFKGKVIDYIHRYYEIFAQNNEFKYHYDESNRHVSTTTQISRSQQARSKCIEIHGCCCNICGFDFAKTYGNLGKDYIEVHHITPIGKLSSAKGYEGTDPQKDLIPLCSNCHSMIHKRKIPYTPDEIRNIINTNYL